MKGEPRDTRRIDAVRARCGAALLLGLLSLAMVVAETKMSLLPIVLALSLLVNGRAARARNAPPITFLLLLPVMIAIAWILLERR